MTHCCYVCLMKKRSSSRVTLAFHIGIGTRDALRSKLDTYQRDVHLDRRNRCCSFVVRSFGSDNAIAAYLLWRRDLAVMQLINRCDRVNTTSFVSIDGKRPFCEVRRRPRTYCRIWPALDTSIWRKMALQTVYCTVTIKGLA